MFRLTHRAASSPVLTGAGKLRPKPTKLGPSGCSTAKAFSQQTSSSPSSHQAKGRSLATDFRFWGAIAATGITSLSLGLLLGSKDKSTKSSDGIQYASQDTMLKVLERVPGHNRIVVILTSDISRLYKRSKRYWEAMPSIWTPMSSRLMVIRTGPRLILQDDLSLLSTQERLRTCPR